MPKPYKIAIVVGTFPVLSQTFIINQVNALIDAGHDVNLYAYKKGRVNKLHQSLKKHDLLNKVNYLKKNTPNHVVGYFKLFAWLFANLFKIRWHKLFQALNFFKYGKESYLLSIFFGLEWSIIEDDFDIIHIHFGHNAKLIAYLKSLGLFSKKTKLITTFHGYDLLPTRHDFYKEVYGIIFKARNRHIVRHCQHIIGVYPVRFIVAIHIGIKLDLFFYSNP